MPDLEGLTFSDPMAFVQAGDALAAASRTLDRVATDFHDTVERTGQRWSGQARLAQYAQAMRLIEDMGRAAEALRWARTAADDGGRAIQSIVVDLRAMVQAAFDDGFIVLMPTGIVQPGPGKLAEAASAGPGAPAATAAFQAMAAVMTADINALVVEANAIDTQIGAQIDAALDQLTGRPPRQRPPGPNLFQPVAATAMKAMTPKQIEAYIEAKYGMPDYNQRFFQQFADREGLIIDVRPTNPESVAWLRRGALPKPYLVKAKTINAIDVKLGAPAGMEGTVGFFKPIEPDPANFTPAEWPKVWARYEQRLDEQTAIAADMAKLEQTGLYQVQDGVVYGRLDPEQPWQPITGDHDIYNIRTRFGDQVPGGEYPEKTPQGTYNQLIQRMVDQQFGVMHGAHMYWRPAPGFQTTNVWAPIIQGHRVGAEELIRFAPNVPPTVVYNIAPIVLPT